MTFFYEFDRIFCHSIINLDFEVDLSVIEKENARYKKIILDQNSSKFILSPFKIVYEYFYFYVDLNKFCKFYRLKKFTNYDIKNIFLTLNVWLNS